MAEQALEILSRPRRLRRTEALRGLARETVLAPRQLILPVFIREDRKQPAAIPSMPGVLRLTPQEAAEQAPRWADLGLGGVMVFGVPLRKDVAGSGAWARAGPAAQGVRAIKGAARELAVVADVCLCAYTTHGHCGVPARGGEVDNDATLPRLARAATTLAAAGADLVAPSAMMDGQVRAIRRALDGAGHRDTGVLAYAAKYASSFYGPFREAAGSTPRRGDRRSYQMDPANGREAMREIALDVAEGADAVMVKPALAYLDVVSAARRRFDVPLAAYSVSGEFAMIEAAAARGWLDRRAAVLEALGAIRRAGADLVITYHAKEAAAWLKQKA